MKTIKYLNREKGITVVLITHYMDEAAQADRVVVMDKGGVIMDDAPKKIFSQAERLRAVGLDVPLKSYIAYIYFFIPYINAVYQYLTRGWLYKPVEGRTAEAGGAGWGAGDGSAGADTGRACGGT